MRATKATTTRKTTKRTKPNRTARVPSKKTAPETIDAYLDRVTDDGQRAALEKLRRTIHAIVPGLEECISYQVPAFRLGGKMLVWFGAASKHLSFFPGGVVPQFEDELAAFETAKGTVRFTPDHPIPTPILRKLIHARMERIGLTPAPARTPSRAPATKTRRRDERSAAPGPRTRSRS